MTREAEKDLDVQRGQPTTIELGEEKITIEQMPLDMQTEALDIYTEAAGKGTGAMIGAMVKIIAKATGRKEDDVKKPGVALDQIVDAFWRIWKQNGFDFLLSRLAKLNEALKPQS